ncbi:polysaccharide deacetylase family protein [Candidatus Falkowbacteria bacterium]|nr:polysaccharide deacetylase family protein [Candidatus Falkowbacteria bacterium]
MLYHSVSDKKSKLSVSKENFESQLEFLSSAGYKSISPRELSGYLQDKKLPAKKILITFDDGFKDNYDVVLPILEKHGFKATFFIVGGYIGGVSVYCSDKSDQNGKMMDSAEIKSLADSGHVIANHFYSHANLIDLPDEEIESEFRQNFDTLKKITDNEESLYFIAYPRNKKDQRVVSKLKSLGVKLAFAGGSRGVKKNSHQFAIPRIEIYNSDSLLKFKAKLSPYYHV